MGKTGMAHYRRLSLAVIERAVDDAAGRFPVLATQEGMDSARQFLGTDNPDLRFWCEVAGVDWRAVVGRYRPCAYLTGDARSA